MTAVELGRRFVNLSEVNFPPTPLAGAWREFRRITLKKKIVLENGTIKVALFPDGETLSGQKQSISLKYMVFEDPDSLAKLGKELIALSLAMRGWLGPEMVQQHAKLATRDIPLLYQRAVRTIKEVLKNGVRFEG